MSASGSTQLPRSTAFRKVKGIIEDMLGTIGDPDHATAMTEQLCVLSDVFARAEAAVRGGAASAAAQLASGLDDARAAQDHIISALFEMAEDMASGYLLPEARNLRQQAQAALRLWRRGDGAPGANAGAAAWAAAGPGSIGGRWTLQDAQRSISMPAAAAAFAEPPPMLLAGYGSGGSRPPLKASIIYCDTEYGTFSTVKRMLRDSSGISISDLLLKPPPHPGGDNHRGSPLRMSLLDDASGERLTLQPLRYGDVAGAERAARDVADWLDERCAGADVVHLVSHNMLSGVWWVRLPLGTAMPFGLPCRSTCVSCGIACMLRWCWSWTDDHHHYA